MISRRLAASSSFILAAARLRALQLLTPGPAAGRPGHLRGRSRRTVSPARPAKQHNHRARSVRPLDGGWPLWLPRTGFAARGHGMDLGHATRGVGSPWRRLTGSPSRRATSVFARPRTIPPIWMTAGLRSGRLAVAPSRMICAAGQICRESPAVGLVDALIPGRAGPLCRRGDLFDRSVPGGEAGPRWAAGFPEADFPGARRRV